MIQRTTLLGSKQSYAYGTNGLLDYENSDLKGKTPKIKGRGQRPAPAYVPSSRGLAAEEPRAPSSRGLITGSSSNNSVYFFYAGGTQPEEQQQNKTDNFYLPGLATFNNSKQPITDLYEVAQGNVAMTSNQTAIKHQYLYMPYGQQTDLDSNTPKIKPTLNHHSYAYLFNQTLHKLNITNNQFGYTGQQKDPSTGLMMLGNFRNYAPGIGRFIQPDIYSPFTKIGVYNTYAYVRANPLAFDDLSGHELELPEPDITPTENRGEEANRNLRLYTIERFRLFIETLKNIKTIATENAEQMTSFASDLTVLRRQGKDIANNFAARPNIKQWFIHQPDGALVPSDKWNFLKTISTSASTTLARDLIPHYEERLRLDGADRPYIAIPDADYAHIVNVISIPLQVKGILVSLHKDILDATALMSTVD